MKLNITDKKIILSFNYNKALIAKCKTTGLEMKWQPSTKTWWLPNNLMNRRLFTQVFEGLYKLPEKEISFNNYIPPAYLMQHQKEAVNFGKTVPRHLFAHATGTGKTILGIELIRQKQIKTLVVCPLSIIEPAWMSDLKQFAPELKRVNLWRNWKRSISDFKRWIEWMDVGIINFESFKKSEKYFDGINMVIIDECFPAGTMIDTEHGNKPIESLKTGDKVWNCKGLSKIQNIFKRYIENDILVLTTIQKQDIISSKNHLFFTKRGWIKAINLRENDYVLYTKDALLLVRQTFDVDSNKKSSRKSEKMSREKGFLREILFSEMENDTAENTSENIQRSNIKENQCWSKEISQIRQPFSKKTIRKNPKSQSNVESGNPQKGFRNIKSNGTQASYPGRERKVYLNPTSKIIRSSNNSISKNRTENGICRPSGKMDARISKKLQAGHSQHDTENRHRSRRIQPQSTEQAGSRQKERTEISGARVESVAIYKSTNSIFDQFRDERDRVVLYDLEIEGHPSFSVNGLLVHNSSKIKNMKAAITKAMVSFCDDIEYTYLFSGTPAPNNEMEYFSQARIIDPTILGKSFYKFREKYFYNIPSCFKWIKRDDTDLLDKIAQFSSVVKKEDVLDLPERTFNTIDVILSPAEKTAYKDMINHLVAIIEDEEISAFNAAVKCMKLRQVTSGFLINENSEVRVFGKSKLNALVDLLEDIGNQQVIIWTQFVHEAEQIKTLLKDKSIGIINGSSKQADKDNWITGFQQGKIQYLIAHPLSMAHGVTLTNCTYSIYYSLSYSHEEHVQSQDRIYRKGTTKPCTYYYLMAPGTIDIVIYNILQGKQKAELAVLDYVKSARNADKMWNGGE